MPAPFDKELRRLSRAKKIVSLLPQRLRFRAAKNLYDYQSASIHGVDLVVPMQDDGAVCFVNTKDLIGWKIFFFGEYERDTNSVLARYVKPGDTVVEAGANMGSESILIGRLVGAGQVYCFEPNPYTFERLKINIAINELANVHAYDYALGEQNGNISFNIYPKGFCNPGMSSKYMETADSKKITVVQKTLDTFVAENNISKVDFIKMDIQGAEMDMLLGAAATIATHKPIIFTEACEPYNNTRELYDKLKQQGYDIHLITGDRTEPMRTTAEVKDGNWLAVYKG